MVKATSQPSRLYVKGTILGFKRCVPLLFYVRCCCSLTMFLVSFHRGRRNTYHHTSLLKIDGVNDKDASNFYFGKKVAYIYKASTKVNGSKFRVVWGKVMRGHGSNGVVRAKFAKNLSVSVLISFFLTVILF